LKKLTVVFLAILTVTLVLPPFFGLLTKSQIEDSIERLATRNSPISVEVAQYQNGWFSSNFEIRAQLSDAYLESAWPEPNETNEAARAVASQSFQGTVRLRHGPLLFSERPQGSGPRLGLGWGEGSTKWDGSGNPDVRNFLDTVGNDHLLKLQMRAGFSGKGDFSATAPKFNYEHTPGNEAKRVEGGKRWTIDFSGFNSTGEVNVSSNAIVMRGLTEQLAFHDSSSTVSVESLAFDMDVIALNKYPSITIGDASMSVEGIVAENNEKKSALDVRRIRFNSSTEVNAQERLSSQVTYTSELLRIDQATIKDFTVGFKLDNLGVSELNQLSELQRAMLGADEASIERLSQEFNGVLHKGLHDSVTLQIDPVALSYNEMPFNSAIRVSNVTEDLPPLENFDLKSLAFWAAILTAEVDVSLHKDLAVQLAIARLKTQLAASVPEGTEVTAEQLDSLAKTQAPQMMAGLVEQGILRNNGAKYALHASYANGELNLNGKPFPLGALMDAQ